MSQNASTTPDQDFYRVHYEQRTTFDSLIAVPAGTPLAVVQQAMDARVREESAEGRDRVYDDGVEVTLVDAPDGRIAGQVNQEFSRAELGS